MQLSMRKPETLIAYENNARTHSDEQIQEIADSIKNFGFNDPVEIGEDNVIISGHARALAAILAGLETIPVVTLPAMDENARKAYILAANKIAQNAGWDPNLLKIEFESLLADDFNVELTGFSDEEIDALLSSEVENLGSCDEDKTPELLDDPITCPGDIWICGRHRVACGDSTNFEDVEKLLNKQKIDLIFTDPPYNVAFNGRSGKFDVIKNDNLEQKEFEDFIRDTCATISQIGSPYYVWCNWKFYGLLQENLDFTACIVWAKNNFGLGTGYRHQHEFCLTNAKVDKEITNESDLWEVKKDTQYVHPTQKPVELAERALKNHKKCKNILDLFGGSGSTLIACEKVGKTAFIQELDPKYVDIIVKRWQEFSGNRATLESTGQAFDG